MQRIEKKLQFVALAVHDSLVRGESVAVFGCLIKIIRKISKKKSRGGEKNRFLIVEWHAMGDRSEFRSATMQASFLD
jgi:hypothetical protein